MSLFFLSMASTAIRVISTVLILAIYSKSLDMNYFGLYVLGSIVGQAVCIFLDSGINSEILRHARVESHDDNKLRIRLSSAVRVALIHLCAAVVASIFIFIYKPFEVLILISSFYVVCLWSVVETIFINIKARGDFALEFKLTALSAIIYILGACFSFVTEWLVPISIVFPRLGLFLFLTRKRVGLKDYMSIRPESVIRHYCNLKAYSIDAISSNINLQIDSLLALLLIGKTEIALYQPLQRIYIAAISMASALSAYVVPKSTLLDSNKLRTKYLFWSFFGFGLLVGGSYFLITPFIVAAMFSDKFIGDVKVLSLFFVLILSRYASAAVGSSLMLLGFQGFRAKVNLLVTVAAITICLFFARSYVWILMFAAASQIVICIIYAAKLRHVVR